MSEFSAGNKIPFEINEPPALVTDDPEKAAQIQFARGQYRAQFTIPYSGDVKTLRDELVRVSQDDELKRVFLYKLDVLPLESEINGEPAARITAVFRVIDNPLPLVAIAWGLTALVGTAGTWLVVDKVEEFTSSGTGSLISILTIASLALGLWVYYDKGK